MGWYYDPDVYATVYRMQELGTLANLKFKHSKEHNG